MVQYWYDAWDNHKVVSANGTTITSSTHIGNVNPFRYRGYYYDTETGLYFLQTRYYDPEVGRFLNRDSVSYAAPEKIDGLNLYAYCLNNPMGLINNGGRAQSYSSINSASMTLNGAMNAGKTNYFGLSANDANNIGHIAMGHYTRSIRKGLAGSIFGTVSFTTTWQESNAASGGVIYSFTNVGNDSASKGWGINIGDWIGASMYTSSNRGAGVGIQITPWFTIGAEISLYDGITFSGGYIMDDVTHEVSFNIGWGTVGLVASAALMASPVLGGRVIGGFIAILSFMFGF